MLTQGFPVQRIFDKVLAICDKYQLETCALSASHALLQLAITADRASTVWHMVRDVQRRRLYLMNPVDS